MVVVTLPDWAICTGQLSASAADLFIEDAHPLLVEWAIDVTVRRPGTTTVLATHSIPLDVEEGVPLSGDRTALESTLQRACRDAHGAVLHNWLVRMAICDDELSDDERETINNLTDQEISLERTSAKLAP